jgi:hypothetical protein
MGHDQPARRLPLCHLEDLGERGDAKNACSDRNPSTDTFAPMPENPNPRCIDHPLRLPFPHQQPSPRFFRFRGETDAGLDDHGRFDFTALRANTAPVIRGEGGP